MKKKARNESNSKYLKFILIAVLSAVLLGAFVLGKSKQSHDSNQTIPSESTNNSRIEYSHPNMDFAITYSKEFDIEEKNHQINLFRRGKEIIISSVSTNYPDLTSHLSDPRNDLLSRISETSELSLNGYEAMSGMLDGKKYYFIYVDNAVYFLSTSSPDLYDELDAIAQSFQYLGE